MCDLTTRGEGITHPTLGRAVVRRGPRGASCARLAGVGLVAHGGRPTVRLGVMLFVLHVIHSTDF